MFCALAHLQVNRPYNATGIFENLHRAVPRKMVDTALAHLVKEEKIQMKTYGKTKIFWLNQDIFEVRAALRNVMKGNVSVHSTSTQQ